MYQLCSSNKSHGDTTYGYWSYILEDITRIIRFWDQNFRMWSFFHNSTYWKLEIEFVFPVPVMQKTPAGWKWHHLLTCTLEFTPQGNNGKQEEKWGNSGVFLCFTLSLWYGQETYLTLVIKKSSLCPQFRQKF